MEAKTRSNFCNRGQHSQGLDSDNLFNREVINRSLLIAHEDIDNNQHLLQQALESLQNIRELSVEPEGLSAAIDQLISYVEYILSVDAHTIETQAGILDPLRSMLFWLPSRFIPVLHEGPNVMLMMAHMHTLALLVKPVQDNESAFFRRLNVAPIQAFHEEFAMRAALEGGPDDRHGQYRRALDLMEFPLNGVAAFERRLLRFGCSLDTNQTRSGQMNSGIGWMNETGCLSTLKILESFPVGLWYNSVS